MSPSPLCGRRVLVAEDDALLALSYAEMLKDVGAEVIGPAATIHEAGKLAASDGIAAALLDIRLEDGEVWPVAQILADKGVPFVFCTGHFGSDTLPPEWSGRPILTKPVRPTKILGALADMLRG